VELAETAEQAERYEDMCQIVKEFVNRSNSCKPPRQLEVKERNLLSVAYKNVIGTRRASWRTLNSEYPEESGKESSKAFIETYKSQILAEIKHTCTEVIEILKALIANLPQSDEKENTEPEVFYLKMAGDYYRYLAESVGGKESGEQAAKYYEQANEKAACLPATNPIRLGLALNCSVCYYEILKDQQKACELAKTAFDEAISKLDTLEESDYKDSTLIMQLLRDNLTLWTADNGDDENVQVQDLSDEEN
jgi:hypothetical protein